MDHARLCEPLAATLAEQQGVISRRQVTAAGLDDGFIERMLRRRERARVHRGAYVDHTGPPTWTQRAWAAVLFYWPAALSHSSAVHLGQDAEPGCRIHVSVRHPRRPDAIPGVTVHRLRRFAQRVQWNLGPPRIRFEDAVLDVCAQARTEFSALASAAEPASRGVRRLSGCSMR